MAQALSKIIDNYGIDIFSHSDQIRAMVLDYVGNDQSDNIGVFCMGCRNEVLCLAQQIYKSNDRRELLRLAQRAKTFLMDQQYMQEQYAVICVNMFLEGMGTPLQLELLQRDKFVPTTDAATSQVDRSPSQEQVSLLEAIDNKKKADREVFQLLREAAQSGDINAMIRLGDYYQYGEVVRRNHVTAEFYYTKAKQAAEERQAVALVDEVSRKLIKLHNSTQHDYER
ncbi:MAG: hypothetical protein ACI3YU_10630 [Segatella copri]